MKTVNSRFGEVEYDPTNTISFPEGLIGFEGLRNFVVIPGKKEGPLFWIQCVEDPGIAFIVTDPTNFFLDYTIQPDDQELAMLKTSSPEDCFVLSIVTVSETKEITLNLAAPVFFSPKSNRAIQVILEDTEYAIKTPLPRT